MSSKIFKAIWIVTISVFIASLLLIMGTLYSYFSSVQKNQLRNQTELAAQGVALSGMDYFEELSIENYRMEMSCLIMKQMPQRCRIIWNVRRSNKP